METTLPVRYKPDPSPYEQAAWQAIQDWKRPARRTWWTRTMNRVGQTWNEVTEQVRRVPGVDWTIDNIVVGLLDLTNEITQDSVWLDAIYQEYRNAGHEVHTHADLQRLDLQHIDDRLAGLSTKYRALAVAEGAATGYAGAAGIMPDIIALVSLTLRAVGEYAAYCGFDIRDPHERLRALHLLDRVSQPGDQAKTMALAPVVRVSKGLAFRQGLQVIEQTAITGAIRNITKALGLNLTRAKLAQVVPVTGAVIGGSYNLLYTRKVCDAAYHLYRERYLLEKYGGAWIEEA